MKNPIYPCLWFDGKAKEAAIFYCDIFPNSNIFSENPLVVNFDLNGNKFMALNGGPTYQLTPANSYVIQCENQEEIDHFWYKLGHKGIYKQCGWLEDQFGVSWQIIPTILGELMSNPEKSQRVMEAFMKMTKFEIEVLKNA
jgi:predicted 3-demethylubiquinone-9 3-methyltransferase (glyoxalase superfamily)